MPRNVLFFAVDDLNVAMGCMGHPYAHTPNIDRLAQRGVLFRNAFTTYPLCGPSRSAMMTGIRPENFPMPDNEVCWRELRPEVKTIPQLAREKGMRAVRCGKIFHHGLPSGPERERLMATKKLPGTFFDPLSWDQEDGDFPYDADVPGKEWLFSGAKAGPGGGAALHAIMTDGDGADLPDFQTADEAIQFLKNTGDEPFFLGVGFVKPHVPLVAPSSFWDKIPRESLALKPSADTPWDTFPSVASFAKTPHHGMTHEQQMIIYQGYLAAMSFMDAQVGRVLETLELTGLAESTLVVFVADHGFHLGEHGQWNKMTFFEESLRVPLIMAGPGVPPRGSVCDAHVETLDLFPTLLELIGSHVPHNDGRSLKPLLENPVQAPERTTRAWLSVPGRQGRSFRTARYRYNEWGNDGADGKQLYDLQEDPFEMKNLASDPAFVGVCRELAAEMRR